MYLTDEKDPLISPENVQADLAQINIFFLVRRNTYTYITATKLKVKVLSNKQNNGRLEQDLDSEHDFCLISQQFTMFIGMPGFS